ncbi:MAG: bifunctional diaminohydroxyphosphoribosylaminopyrimidine deaminase/5-amino-6-(5-phosphoribosylamino)uracil reductase RibD [Actinobacteria bacterium]|nr:bifunctional diaminohydroxyphosphoribosylaminopyrimidine deaminase/5-amino-6-(5-phosphoribosylamino)uracil reductase RibD [Actinomycetota bacterium]
MTIFSKQDSIFMKKAISLAEKGRGRTRPNPMVGAVIVRDGKIVSTGYHRKAGADHAEVDAIKNSPVPVKGADMYVTLEPCSIQGRTPPCTDALISNGLKRVIIGATDPNPRVNGSGIKKLKEAGIEVASGLFSEEIARQNEIFFKHMGNGLPFVCAKIASSLDGKLAARTSDSKWITSPGSREIVQALRMEYGCILTGINTVIADDPTLFPKTDPGGTVEDNLKSFINGDHPAFYRVALDTDLRIPLDSSLLNTASSISTIIFAASACRDKIGSTEKIQKLKDSKAALEFMDGSRLDPEKVLKILYGKYGIISVILEAGPAILTSFLTKGLIDKFMIFIAPKIIGGDSPYNMFGKLENDFIDDSTCLEFYSFERTGSDIMIIAYPDMKNNKRTGR